MNIYIISVKKKEKLTIKQKLHEGKSTYINVGAVIIEGD
jgi:hypothetical protein